MVPFARVRNMAAWLLVGLLVPPGLTFALPASAKTAKCSVHSADGNFNAPCNFLLRSGGSFTIRAPGKPVFPRVSAIMVDIQRDGSAEVKAVMENGIFSPWGTAQRSRSDRACWVGEDFWVCVYG